MATLDLDNNESQYQINSYRAGEIKINQTKYAQSVILTATQLVTNWPPQSVADLSADSFQAVIALQPAILLIGTGSEIILLDISLYGHLINHGIGVEVMDTLAACRTFNALTAENRNVAAALLIR